MDVEILEYKSPSKPTNMLTPGIIRRVSWKKGIPHRKGNTSTIDMRRLAFRGHYRAMKTRYSTELLLALTSVRQQPRKKFQSLPSLRASSNGPWSLFRQPGGNPNLLVQWNHLFSFHQLVSLLPFGTSKIVYTFGVPQTHSRGEGEGKQPQV